MRVLIFLLLTSISFVVSAQNGFGNLYISEALKIAKEEGTFVIAVFSNHPVPCSGCEFMVQRGELRDSIYAVQSRFVGTWIYSGQSNIDMLEYGVKKLPTVLLLDANGKEYFRSKTRLGAASYLRLLNEFPEDMSGVYAADSIVQEFPNDLTAQLNLAKAYQEAARNAQRPIAKQLAKFSDEVLKDAARILRRDRDAPSHMKERLKLMEAENLLLRERAMKAIVAITVMEQELHESNEALAYYIKGAAYRTIDLPDLAEDYYDKLQLAPDNEEFLTRCRKQEE